METEARSRDNLYCCNGGMHLMFMLASCTGGGKAFMTAAAVGIR